MVQVFFHVEVETDCLNDEVENPPPAAQLETETIEYVAELFGRPVTTHGRRHDGALICSLKAESLAQVRKVVRDNLLTEGNDQIVAGEYVIVRDFEFESSPLGLEDE